MDKYALFSKKLGKTILVAVNPQDDQKLVRDVRDDSSEWHQSCREHTNWNQWTQWTQWTQSTWYQTSAK